MKIAVPVDNELTYYRKNPFTAPKFAIYYIDADIYEVSFGIDNIVDNPQYGNREKNFCEAEMEGICPAQNKKNINHICEHYALLEIISGCTHLIASKFCENTYSALQKGCVDVFKIPSIINSTEMAIKNFIIGASIANKVKNISFAS